MDLSPILNPLNDAQRAAVTAPLGPVLVLAGAGSGKTRVLTHRIAWLIQTEGVSPHGVLAVTFTNKAAAEMRGRVEQLLGMPGSALWLGTFHGIAHRLLRLHWREAGLVQSFQILDAEDQLRLIKKLLKAQELDENRWVPREVQYFINKHKDEGRRPQHLKSGQRCHRSADAQALRAVRGDLRALRRDRLRRAAAARLRALARSARRCCSTTAVASATCWSMSSRTPTRSSTRGSGCWWARTGAPFVVGDDDQSIYRWRGAASRTCTASARTSRRRELCQAGAELPLHRRDSRGCQRADRATSPAGLGKTLWTNGARGDPVTVYAAYNERDEADFVVDAHPRVDAARRPAPRERAILYRSNAQSRVLRGGADQRARALPGLRRPALLRARRDQGRARLPAPDRQSRR